MSDLRELYQELILDHGRKPRNAKPLANPTHKAEGFNPLCGDQLTLYVKLADGIIEDIALQGAGAHVGHQGQKPGAFDGLLGAPLVAIMTGSTTSLGRREAGIASRASAVRRMISAL